MQKKIAFTALLLCAFLILGRDLNPLQQEMFVFHDKTQVGRIEAFAENIKAGQIPPRIAPEFSFRLGYPLFNYYAPAAYWITAIPIIFGMYAISATKLSFLIAIVSSFAGMFFWLRNRFSFWSSVLGAVAYVTSPYFATEIFIRGSISEVWFLALLPISLLLLDLLNKKMTLWSILGTTIAISLLITTHNVLSLVGLAILIAYVILNKIKKGPIILVLAFLLGSYFFIPALMEIGQTHAVLVASGTKYSDHFLCLWQLWTSIGWGYGASVMGCIDDGMSFKLGKLHIILAGISVIYILWHSYRNKTKPENTAVLIFLITIVSLFLTLFVSEFIWKVFEPILKVFQFPWRFLVFGVFGIAYFMAYGADFFRKLTYQKWVVIVLVIFLFIANSKFFERDGLTYEEYHREYLSESFLRNHLAHQIPEYLPKSANARTWHSYSTEPKTPTFLEGVLEAKDTGTVKTIKNESYERVVETSSRNFLINIHTAPYWHVFINDQEYIVKNNDDLGRPQVQLSSSVYPQEKNTIKIIYKQTLLQNISNIISIATLLVLIVFSHTYGRKGSKKE